MMRKIISEARKWSDSLWRKAISAWSRRQQDHNYRRYVVRPALKQVIDKLNFHPKIVVDLGCAEGKETVFLSQLLSQTGFKPQVYGFDPQSKLIAHATKDKGIIFASGDFIELVSQYKLKGKIDLLTAIFVLQDLPELSSFLEAIEKNLSANGQVVFFLVHPAFGQAMLEKSVLVLNKHLNYLPQAEWDFVSAYPIVEENGQIFFVPYFHRSVEEYLSVLQKYFQIINVKGLKPSDKVLKYCQQQKISPFVNHPGNVYYPEIINQVSTLLITVNKKEEEND